MDLITINVSGRRFEVNREVVMKLPDKAQCRYLQHHSIHFRNGQREYFFERHADVFQSVLYFYQTGKLHMPTGFCPGLFKSELDFWGLDVSSLENCCFDAYNQAYENKCRLDKFEAYYRDYTRECIQEHRKTKWNNFRKRAWYFFDHPFASRAGKIYYWTSIVAICLAIAALTLGTMDEFKTVIDASERAENYALQKHFSWTATSTGIVDEDIDGGSGGGGNSRGGYRDGGIHGSSAGRFSETNNSHWNSSDKNLAEASSGFSYKFTHRIPAISLVEFICLIFFTLETIAKLLVCPRVKLYFASLINVIDLVAVLSYYAWLTVNIYIFHGKPIHRIGDIIEGIAVMRVFRLLRLAKHVRGLRVLLYTIKSNLPEVLLFYVMLFLACILFGSVMYYLDNHFDDIPDAMWWAVITLTTIGYGDVTPGTAPGKILASFCAGTGLLIIAVTVPIFVVKFLLFYNHMDRHRFISRIHAETLAHEPATINITHFESPFNRKAFSRRAIRKRAMVVRYGRLTKGIKHPSVRQL